MNIVWLKRDLRLKDHQPLLDAASAGETLILYVVEPSVWKSSGMSKRQLRFVIQGLEDVKIQLENIGGRLAFYIGEMNEVLSLLAHTYGVFHLWSYCEGGSTLLNHRNAFVKEWIQEKGFYYSEIEQYEKLRKKQWLEKMNQPIKSLPRKIFSPKELPIGFFEDVKSLFRFEKLLQGELIVFGEQGGEKNAEDTLKLSLKAEDLFYRLTSYLAWGNISSRMIWQKVSEVQSSQDSAVHPFLEQLFAREMLLATSNLGSISMEQPVQRVEKQIDSKELVNWEQGKTGFPIIDAIMRSLQKTGHIEEELKEIVVSFAHHFLLLQKEQIGFSLAKMLIDYDPPSHWAKLNQYVKRSPLMHTIKTGKKIDPHGEFIKRHVIELKQIPAKYTHEPWLYPGFFALNYPSPVFDYHKEFSKAKRVRSSQKKTDLSMGENSSQLTLDI
ncbi:FAD-binding domain-containing protein [Bacillus sp. 2205SS5-2]|uniref:FAD-binding domain-containing protein n=1 Tax=Bacillus sp. 2205SS5-2 TaxID=3109031 RepID=UPI0030076BB2